MASEVPWRKNLKSGVAPAGGNVQKPPAPVVAPPAQQQQTPPPLQAQTTEQKQQQPKSTKLQINLKSVKKPDAPPQPQTDKLPPVHLNPVLPENKATTNSKPPTGKSIPITIQKSTPAPAEPQTTTKPPVPTTTIPIQRTHQQQQQQQQKQQQQSQNDSTPNKTATPIKTESKVKPKPGANSSKSSKSTAATPKQKVEEAAAATPPPPPSQTKMAPPPPPPAPPPPPGGGPPPPPPPPGGPNAGLPPKPPQVKAKIEQLKKAPRKRPDWANMMKEIETGRKLKKVQCNDRSKPILPKMKSRGKFVFDSEAKPASKSDAIHNRLLTEIQHGIKLKRVQCNDRSKPQLSGLRTRRQSSIVETDIQKVSSNSIPEPEELAFVMDIDVLRDELQSAKQMLEMEMESKHNVEKKNRDQKCQIIAMEAEIETLKVKLGLIPEDEVSMLSRGLDKSDSRTFKHLRKSGSGLWKSPSIVGIKKSKSGITKDLLPPKVPLDNSSRSDQQTQQQNQQQDEELNEVNELEEEISSLKQTVQHARKQAEEMERKYKEAMDKLLVAQGTLEDSEQKRRVLEKKVETLQAQNGNKPMPPIVQTAERTTQTEEQILEKMLTRQQSTRDEEFSGSEEEDSDMEVDEETVQRKKQEREIKLWENKLKSCKDKQHASRLERKNLKNLQKKLEEELKEAKKRHKKLQKEVDKMAKMLKEAEKGEDDEDEEEEEANEEEEPEEEEETEEEESEEEESESESEPEEDESSEEDDEDASHEERLNLFGKRIKRRENVLNALRKTNYLLRANIDRLKDDLEDARISYHDLEHELSSVVDDL